MKTTRKYIVPAETCGACIHYYQHYVLTEGGRFQALWSGHCGTPLLRDMRPDGTCPRWQGPEQNEREPDSLG